MGLEPLLDLLAESSTAALGPATLHSAASTSYFSQLLGLSLDKLAAEPETLSKSAAQARRPVHAHALTGQLDGELAALCFRSYPTFLLAHECSTAISSSFSELEASLTGLIAASDGLARTCETFDAHAAPSLRARAKIGEALEHVDRLADILELPRLVATCVRSGQWAEALDLAQRADELERRASAAELAGSARLLGRVRDDIAREIIGLRATVLEALRDRALKLPAAIRAIAILRRLGGPDAEPELRLTFLAARADCLASQLEQLQAGAFGDADEDRVRFVKRWIEVWRDVVGDAASIFPDVFLSVGGVKALVPLHAFLQRVLAQLLAMLEQHLPQITPVSSLSSILTQLAYCAAAFGRHGLDFRPLVAARIGRRVGEVVTARWDTGADAFRGELERGAARKDVAVETWLVAPDARARALAADLPDAPPLPAHLAGSSNLPASLASDGADRPALVASSSTPAQSLTLFPPIARLANAHASALNELRLMPATVLYPGLRAAQTRSLIGSGEALLELAATTTTPAAADLVRQAFGWFARSLVPFCEAALRSGVYGRTDDVEPDALAGSRVRWEEALEALERTAERREATADADGDGAST